MRVESDASRLRLRGRRLRYGEIRYVVAGPFLAVPPYPLLPLAPGLAVRVSRRAVVQETPVGRPGVTPIQLRAPLTGRIRLLARGEVPVGRGKAPGVNPRRAGRRSIVGERGEAGDVLAGLRRVVPVHFLEKLLDVRLSSLPVLRVV